MKLIKRLLLVLFILVVLVVGGVVFAITRIDSLAKTAIEKGTTAATGAQTSVQEVRIGFLAGTFDLAGLKVANPAGFQSPEFFSLGKGGLTIDPLKLQGDTIEVPRVSLDTIGITLERRDGKTNYKAILDNMGRLKTGGGSKPSGGSEKRFIINELDIRDVKVTVDMVGGPQAVSELTRVIIPIDEITLTNVGKTGDGVAGTGVTMSELSNIVIAAVLNAATEKGGPLLPADLLGDLQGKLGSLGIDDLHMKVVAKTQAKVEELGKKFGEEAKKAVDDAKKKAKDAVDSAADKLKGLIPGPK
ncbi:MAG: AsmA family protein [Phycisphaerales bacterium]